MRSTSWAFAILFWIGAFWSALFIFFLLSSSPSEGKVLEVSDCYIEAASYQGLNYDSYLNLPEGEYLQHLTAFGLDANLLRDENTFRVYWNNRILGKATNKQYRHVSWEFELGLNIMERTDFFYHHVSEHILERNRPEPHFPLNNHVGIRLHFVK